MTKAQAIVEAVLRISPKNGLAHRLMASILSKNAQAKEVVEVQAKEMKQLALAHYQASFKADSGDIEAAQGLVDVAIDLGDKDLAVETARTLVKELERLVKEGGSAEFVAKAQTILGQTLVKAGQEAEGMKVLAKAKGISGRVIKDYQKAAALSKQIKAKEAEKGKLGMEKAMLQLRRLEGNALAEAQKGIDDKEVAFDDQIHALKIQLSEVDLSISDILNLQEQVGADLGSTLALDVQKDFWDAAKESPELRALGIGNIITSSILNDKEVKDRIVSIVKEFGESKKILENKGQQVKELEQAPVSKVQEAAKGQESSVSAETVILNEFLADLAEEKSKPEEAAFSEFSGKISSVISWMNEIKERNADHDSELIKTMGEGNIQIIREFLSLASLPEQDRARAITQFVTSNYGARYSKFESISISPEVLRSFSVPPSVASQKRREDELEVEPVDGVYAASA